MTDIIRLLPDSVANQIAAGEVIQRPASVVKELVENSIDAGADKIIVNIKDAGKTLIQVTDNGKGMSETDARMAFERHATSKIKFAEDLFSVNTMGFRGEALASIAAVADVELKTKPHDKELGTYIHIKGSELIEQETISCGSGSTFSVKNLFFNIPARRKFLKKEATEFRHIVSEFKKTALANPDIEFELYHNETLIYKLKKEQLKYRIVNVCGKNYKNHLIPVGSSSSILNITGFVGTPETAKKRNEDQYFFVNGRFMKHSYFYKAVLSAYEQIIKPDYHPSFFLYFDIAPENIDINIHPAKIQINFEDTQGIFQILRASVKKALGESDIVPSIYFNSENTIYIPHTEKDKKDFSEPPISSGHSYNPFEEEKISENSFIFKKNIQKEKIPDNWEDLYKSFDSQLNFDNKSSGSDNKTDLYKTQFFQFKKKYLISSLKSGLLIINIKRAHERILFEKILKNQTAEKIDSQQMVYPVEIQLNEDNIDFLRAAEDELSKIGFNLEFTDDDKVIVKGIPGFLTEKDTKSILESVLVQVKDDVELLETDAYENLAEVIAKQKSMNFAKILAEEELQEIINGLFMCENPAYTKDGRKILHKISVDEIDSFF